MAYVDAGDAVSYDYTVDRENGRQTIDTHILSRDSTIEVIVEADRPRPGTIATDFTLRVDITSSNATVPAGVPVEIELKRGEWVRGQGDSDVKIVLAHGPDDVLVGRLGGAFDFQAEMAGKYVFVAGPAGSIRYTTNGTAEGMRALPIAHSHGDALTPGADRTTEWTFQVDAKVFLAGLYIKTADSHGAAVHTVDETYRVTGPVGVVIEGMFVCNVCLSAPPGATLVAVESEMGDPKLVPGAYTGRYDRNGSWGILVGHYTVAYER